MIIDNLLEFADATSVAAAAGTALIGDVVDTGSVARDIGTGEPLYLVISVDTQVITGGSAGTLQFVLASDAQAAIATDGTATVHWASRLFVTDDAALAELDAGDTIIVPFPSGDIPPYERYIGILAVTATTTTTAGAISAFLTHTPGKFKSYPDATN